MALQTPTDTPYGLKPNVAAGLAYLFGIVGGIVILLGGGTNKSVKWAAAQSITMWGLYIVLIVALSFLGYMAGFIGMITWLIEIVWFILWLWTFISGFQGKDVEVPVIAGITRSLFKSTA
jgi:uncharacterized membrane protein